MSGADAAEHTVGEEGAAAALFPPVDDGALLEEMPGLAEACRRFPMPDGTPVSYTHLDVYKRQGQVPLITSSW